MPIATLVLRYASSDGGSGCTTITSVPPRCVDCCAEAALGRIVSPSQLVTCIAPTAVPPITISRRSSSLEEVRGDIVGPLRLLLAVVMPIANLLASGHLFHGHFKN